jgi:septal ring factor EnvC (AmiA/AmiB activator)
LKHFCTLYILSFNLCIAFQYANHITEENEKQKEEIEVLNSEIKDLTTELVSKKGRRGKGKDADLAAELENLEEELDKIREKLSSEQTEMLKLRAVLKESEATKVQALSAKSQSDSKIKEQLRRIEDLGNELVKATNVSNKAEILSKESNKVKGDTVKETRRLLGENELLQDEVN